MKKLSQSDIAVLWLHDCKGQWIPSHQLLKVNTPRGWLGTASTRRLREIAAKGFHMIDGAKYYVEVQDREYAYYRCIGATKQVVNPIFKEENGIRSVEMRQETLSL